MAYVRVQAAVDKGLEKVIAGIGSTMLIFLSNLNRFFLKLQLTMDLPDDIMPDFRVKSVTECQSETTSLELHYRSQRPLSSWIEGVCEEVGEMFFKVHVNFEHLSLQLCQDKTTSINHSVRKPINFSPESSSLYMHLSISVRLLYNDE